jgi:hypothetical protein
MLINFPKWKLVAFTLLSACDFIITYLLLSHSKGMVYESNPVANESLQQGGWIGLAAFKAAIVCVVAVIATYLFYRRPRVAHDLLAIACGALVVAVLSGTTIAFTFARARHDETMSILVSGPLPRDPLADKRNSEYVHLMDDAGIRLVAKEFNLAQGAEYVRMASLSQGPAWFDSLRQTYPGLTDDRALLAANLVQHTVNSRLGTPSAAVLAEELESDFRRFYGVTPNFPYRQLLHLIGSPLKGSGLRGKKLPIPAI